MKAIRSFSASLGLVAGLSAMCAPVHAALITFDDVVVNQTTFAFDGDGDGIKDVVFSTTDPQGFRTTGPGLNQTYIHEPGLEGTALLNPDLRLDFIKGAVGSLSFGYALDSRSSAPNWFASIQVFDAGSHLIGSGSQAGAFTVTNPPNGLSSFPEGQVSVSFSGIARYATFDFTSESGRYIVDDFKGTFGSTEPIPEPATFVLLGAGLAALAVARRRRR